MTTFIIISSIVAVICFLVTIIILKIDSRHFGIRYLFSKKRRAIISGVIDLIKTDPDGWTDVGCSTKIYNESTLSIRTDRFGSKATISNRVNHTNRYGMTISFLESIWLDWYFLKLVKKQRKQQKIKKKLEDEKAIDGILLIATKMDEL
jgi:hypothetical protein